ncbi:MAG: ImmA/IrrE family metallo-endopeptidase [bacterium]
MRVAIEPKLILWARQRAGLDNSAFLNRFPKLQDWEQGISQPTLKQLETFANATHVPLGIFFLPEPPKEQLPIPDFRMMGSALFDQTSPDLLETIYLCQQRQEWYREYMQLHRAEPLNFVDSATIDVDIIKIAAEMRQILHFDLDKRQQLRMWSDAMRLFVESVEKQGILVMASGVVGSNNKRTLKPEEFRGFVLVDKLAPVIFINSRDTKAAQMFTLAHELAHIWLGESGISDVQAIVTSNRQNERWCNQVAAEFLVPLENFQNTFTPHEELQVEMQRLARRYKVSTLVILRRIYDLGAMSYETLSQTYGKELDRLKKKTRRSGDRGDFYQTLGVRVSRRFANALVTNTLEGQTLFRDAFRMLGIKKSATFYQVAKKLGVKT